MDTIEDTIELKNKFRSRSTSSTSLVQGFTMSHFMDKLAMSLGWGPNPLKVVSVSWTDYKDRLEEDLLNVAVAVVVQNSEGEKSPAWEVIIHYTINAHNHCYSLMRCGDREEACATAATYRQKLPPLVAAVGREFLNHSTLQKVTDLLREQPSYQSVHLAAHFGFLEALKSDQIKKYINAGEASRGFTALHIAVRQDSDRVVAALLVAGADPSVPDAANSDTPLHLAATKTEAMILALGVEERPCLNLRNKQGKTALMIAAESSRLDNIKLLLRLGANPNHEPEVHRLFHTPEYKMGLKTIETAKDISSKDLSKGGNLLHWVKTRELMHLCLDLCIAPNVQNNAGQTPLHVMVCRQRVPCLVTLLSRGADPNIADEDGNTPLHVAARMLAPTMVQALIVFGSRLHLTNKTGETARHLAASQQPDDPAQQTCRGQVIYLLHTVGAPRCASRLADCCEGCLSDGQFNGVPVYQKPLVRSRWVMDHLLELSQINQAIQWQGTHQPHLRGTGRVLCLDGGGIKGLVLTQQLFALEEALARPIRECFDWVCGTSTGGFLALMLATGKSVKAVQTLYYSLKEKVFVGSRPYDSGPLEDVLRKEFGEEATMSSIQGLKVMVTSTLADRLPPDLHLFRNYDSPMSVIGLPESSHFAAPLPPGKQKIWLAARSSGAAPTYFSALEQYVDGGMIANNPTLDTLTEIEEWNMAVRSQGRHDEVFVPTVVVSLGCGKAPLAKVENIDVVVPNLLDMRRGFQAVYNLFNLLVDSACPSQGRVTDRARAWCSALHVPFIRLNPQLSTDIALDESSDEKLLRIMWEARAELQRNSKMVEHLKYLLLPPSTNDACVPNAWDGVATVPREAGVGIADGGGDEPEGRKMQSKAEWSGEDVHSTRKKPCISETKNWTDGSQKEKASASMFRNSSEKFSNFHCARGLASGESISVTETDALYDKRNLSSSSINSPRVSFSECSDGRSNSVASKESLVNLQMRRGSFDQSINRSTGNGHCPKCSGSSLSIDNTLVPQLSLPDLSELLARSGVNPATLAPSMPEILHSLGNRCDGDGLLCHSSRHAPGSRSAMEPHQGTTGDDARSTSVTPFTGSSGLLCSISDPARYSYPISDPPGYPYLVNNVEDPNSTGFLPFNPLNPISGEGEDGRSVLGLGLCPDSPASIRSLRMTESGEGNSEVDPVGGAVEVSREQGMVDPVARTDTACICDTPQETTSIRSAAVSVDDVMSKSSIDAPLHSYVSNSPLPSRGSAKRSHETAKMPRDCGCGGDDDAPPPTYHWALRHA